eukprot:574720-Hanusia_phi.AAC.1
MHNCVIGEGMKKGKTHVAEPEMVAADGQAALWAPVDWHWGRAAPLTRSEQRHCDGASPGS